MIRFKLHQELEKQNKTMYWLSKQSGVRPNTISQWVNDLESDEDKKVKSINVDILNKLCIALKCNVSDLIEFTEEEKTDA
ncbi:transcriptional regulator [Alkalihalophilus pseudofirmus]|nr:transcriptional regulator [Alkalihalophilus pseudofirmus]